MEKMFNKTQQSEICNLYISGKTGIEIAKIFNCNYTTVYDVLRDNGVKARTLTDYKEDNLARLLSKTKKQEFGCWEWIGEINKYGYGRFWINGRSMQAHRASYELHNNVKVPSNLVMDHLCRNKKCVNPNHLEPVTNWENVRRGESPIAKNEIKTHCIKGHPFSEENTRILPRGERVCLICQRARNRAYMKKYLAKHKVSRAS